MLDGSTVARESSDPSYGIYAYTAREWDPEIGLYYYRARYYDPKQGRFISEDPIGLKGGVNFYSYVRSRPVNRIDPLGLLGVNYCPGGAKHPETGDSRREGAALCCKGGRGVLCVDRSWWYEQSSELRKCITEHEETHDKNIGNRCRCSPNQDGCTVMTYRDRQEHGREECLARLVEYICLRDSSPPHGRTHRASWTMWKRNRSADMDYCLRNNFFF